LAKQNEHGLARRAREIFAAEGEDERLAGAGDAANDAVAFA
jgi:hypothetical protein